MLKVMTEVQSNQWWLVTRGGGGAKEYEQKSRTLLSHARFQSDGQSH